MAIQTRTNYSRWLLNFGRSFQRKSPQDLLECECGTLVPKNKMEKHRQNDTIHRMRLRGREKK